MATPHAVIIGGGHAAAQLAPSLRQLGWQGDITLVCDEPVLPYQRPPLSKAYLLGQVTAEQLLIKQASAYEKAGVNVKLGVRAERVDRATQQVHLSTGEVLGYTGLALTLGARVRRLDVPGATLPGVHHLRSLADVDGIQASLAAGGARHAVIVGGGYIGLETAAVLRKLGVAVTVLEAQPRLLQRVTTEEVAGFYHRVHSEEGVTILCNKTVRSILGTQGVEGVVCEDGAVIEADLVVVGIGVLPHTALAAAAGLETAQGIVVNAHAQTSDPAIVAAGDCTEFFSEAHGRHLRLESVPHAMAQASCAAATLCGQRRPYVAQPWFWSDQYDIKLQMAGLSQGHDQAVIRGDLHQGRSFSVFYLRAGRLLAADCINRPKEFMGAKKLLAADLVLSPDRLADESQDLSQLLTP
jgi:3-phenylpropionate/trans-cinnamate dioxygenase ferredoxin reductase subunit